MTMENKLNLPVLTDTEKAYYDTIKQVAQGPRPDDLVLQRMAMDAPEPARNLAARIKELAGTPAEVESGQHAAVQSQLASLAVELAEMVDAGVQPCAVVSQKIIRAEDATFLGYQPLAMLIDDDEARLLIAPDGSRADSVNPHDAEGSGGP
jgi:hypothetical protein